MDFINWAKEHDISVGPGRGSGAGSIVAYALRITDINPLKYGLLFERFLNPDRISMPDFDIDFAKEGRDDVLNYVTTQYGKDRVGQIITFGTLGAKAVIKDVARTLSISIDEAEKIAKLIPFRPGITLKQAFEEEPRLREMEEDPRYTELFALARKLEGLNRHSSIHAAGVVIGKSELHNFVPLFRDSKTGIIATQYAMNHLEDCGLVKMDFLGLKTLDVIKHTEELIRNKGGEYAHFSVQTIPEDDSATFKMLSDGQSFEIFQFESDGMQNILKQAKPDKIEDLIALNALYRPGPMDNIPQFVNSKNGKEAIHYPDPRLEDILKETYGVIVYQEQVMQVAQIIAGYSMGKADLLRRAMGKKKKEILDAEKVPFLEGAVKQGYPKSKASAIFDMLVPFAGYGFNKSHAAAYSVVAYHTAYLKANFPAEFMAANLSNEIHSANKDKLSECIDESRKMGIEIDPPDVNRSEKLFTIADGHIVYGLLGIKGLGDSTADEIVRGRNGDPYQNFMDFLTKVDIKLVGKAVIEKLIQTGAFDRLGVSRENLLGNLERAVEYALKQKEDKSIGQSSLFGDTGENEYTDFTFENFPETSRLEKLKIEKQLIGFYFSGHPMDDYRDLWQRAVKVDLGHPETAEPGSQILVGVIKAIRIANSKSGKMAYITIGDYNGEIDMIFFSRIWEASQGRIQEDQIAIVRGKIDYQKDRDKYSFIAESLIDLREAETAMEEEDASRRKREKFRNAWLYMADLKSGGLARTERGSYTILGQLTALRETKDRNGNDMAFGTLRDFEGDIDLVFFSKIWNECRDFLSLDEFIALKGSIDPSNDRNPQKPGFKVSSIADIAALSRSAARKVAAGDAPEVPVTSATLSSATPQMPSVHVRLNAEATNHDEGIYPLQNYLLGNPGPCRVFIHVPTGGGEKIIRLNAGVSPETKLENCKGVAETWKE
jgi:DNA polymerase-3 subunit alpha